MRNLFISKRDGFINSKPVGENLKMEFNIAKYNVLKNYGRLEGFLHFSLHTSQLHGCCLEAIDITKYLRVYLSKDLRWNDHMQKKTQTKQIRR